MEISAFPYNEIYAHDLNIGFKTKWEFTWTKNV